MRLSRTAAFYLQFSILVSFLAGSSAPTPLYPIYQAAWGFSPITTTIVFGIYAIAVLGALLVVGSLSDHVGRRPVLIVAAVMQAATMLVFAGADGVPMLIAARVVQGLATGGAAGAAGAGMLDIDRDRGAITNAIGSLVGTGTGGLVSGLFVQYLPAPTELVYVVMCGIFVVQAILVTRIDETATRKPGAAASLVPQFKLPAAVRAPLLLAAPAIVAAWALVGFYASLGPALVRALAADSGRALGGIALTVFAFAGVSTVLVMRTRQPRALLLYGTVALVVGVAVTLAGVRAGSVAALFAGFVIAGSGFGTSFQGGIRGVVAVARADERAGVLSILYVISYLAMGAPTVLGGVRVVYGDGLLATTTEYGIAVIVLAAAAFVGTLLRDAPPPAVVTSTR